MSSKLICCLNVKIVCEALPVQLVNDIFFLHERGKRIGYYTGSEHDVDLYPVYL